MMKKKRNQWRKWQASAAATLAVAALFQYVRSSDAFDVAYASANGIEPSNTPNSEVATRDDVMDEWNYSRTDSSDSGLQYNQDDRNNQQNQQNDSRSYSGSYQSRTGAS